VCKEKRRNTFHLRALAVWAKFPEDIHPKADAAVPNHSALTRRGWLVGNPAFNLLNDILTQ
jgi:hypothetical protein